MRRGLYLFSSHVFIVALIDPRNLIDAFSMKGRFLHYLPQCGKTRGLFAIVSHVSGSIVSSGFFDFVHG